MAKITRKLLKVFGGEGTTTNFAVFGSAAAATPAKSMDIELIQSLDAWIEEGWVDAVNASNKAPFIEDMNAAMFVMAYQLGYILQDGIPDWNALTTYYTASVVRKTGTAELYSSIVDDNLNQALGSKVTNSKWTYLVDLAEVVPASFITTARIANDAVDKDKIAADVAGNGLGQNADGSLEVKVDGSTIEVSSDTLRVKDAGIVNAKIGARAVTEDKISALTANTIYNNDEDVSLTGSGDKEICSITKTFSANSRIMVMGNINVSFSALFYLSIYVGGELKAKVFLGGGGGLVNVNGSIHSYVDVASGSQKIELRGTPIYTGGANHVYGHNLSYMVLGTNA